MPLHRVDHITLNSSDLEKSCCFYSQGLGFTAQPMEGRGLKGAWLLLGGHPYVHLISRPPKRSPDRQSPDSRGPIDHFALEATGLSEMRQRLTGAGVSFRENPLPDMDLHQILVEDPDGVKVELNFRGAAARDGESSADPGTAR